MFIISETGITLLFAATLISGALGAVNLIDDPPLGFLCLMTPILLLIIVFGCLTGVDEYIPPKEIVVTDNLTGENYILIDKGNGDYVVDRKLDEGDE